MVGNERTEADELAHWLRGITAGWSVRALAAKFPHTYGRNQWSEFRRGTKLIPRFLLEDLVAALIKDPRTRQMQLLKGTELLEAAEAAARARCVAAAEIPPGTVVELQLRLDDARQGEIAAKDALLGTSRLVYMLLEMVSSLHQRCTRLEQERDQARAANPPTGHQTVLGELNNTQALLSQATARLHQARRERQTAEELRLLAEQQAALYRRALEDMSRRADDSATAHSSGASSCEGAEAPWAQAGRPPLWEYEAALEAADEELAAHQFNMAAAREQMGAPAPVPDRSSPSVVVGEVVRGVRADSPAAGKRSTEPPRGPRIWGNVPPRNPNFTGRVDLLERLSERLRGDTTALLLEAIHGMGGVGKTQLALEYVYRHQSEYDVVWWIPAERPDRIGQALVALAQRLGLVTSSEASIAGPLVREALCEGRPYSRWLLIFDNADSPDVVRNYFPTGGSGTILITSRNRRWSVAGPALEVNVFAREESKELLRRLGPSDLDDAEADRLADALGDLPLALEQAAAWRAETGRPASEYLRLFEHKGAELLTVSPPLDYQLPVAVAWNVSMDHLEERSPTALRLLQLCSYFAPGSISVSIFSGHGGSTIDPALARALTDPLQLTRALREINRHSLARIDYRTNSIEMHPLVQLILKNHMTSEERSRMRKGAHMLLAAANPGKPADPMTWPLYAELYGHVIASEAIKSDQPSVHNLVRNVAHFLFYRGDHTESLVFSEQVWATWNTPSGAEDQQTLLLGPWLGFLYWAAGRFDDAAQLVTHLREVYERTAPAEVEDTREDALESMMLEAAVHRVQGHFAAGRDLDEIAYDRARRAFGEGDPMTLRAAHNLGVSLRLAGQFQQALDLDRHTHALKTRLYGRDHRDSLITEASIAVDLREAGDYAGARSLLEAVVDALLPVLGARNSTTLNVMRLLSESCRKEGDHARSLELATEAHTMLSHLYGETHPHPQPLASTLTLSVALRHNGDLPAARTQGVKASEGYRQLYDPHHPLVLSANVDLAVTLRLLGKPKEARSLDDSALTSLTDRLGTDHPLALICAINLASDLAALGRHDDARRRGEKLLALCRTVLGENHPTTLACAANLALDLVAAGAEVRGNTLREETLERMGRVLDAPRLHRSGAPHPVTVHFRQGQRVDCDIDPMPL
ncbi:FxSxx-COOH system tetratricopeptide repeat protein [Streptomyces chartreusis]